MSGVKIVSVSPEILLVAATKQTMIQWIAAANHRTLIKQFTVSFKGISNTAEPALIEVEEQADAGSDGTGLTVGKYNPSDDETIQTTGLYGIDGSVQPTATVTKFREEVHPQGSYTWQAPFGDEIPVPGGGRCGLAITVPAGVIAVATFLGEE